MIKKAESPHKPAPEKLRGRSIFAVETTAEGIKVQTAFLTDDGKILVLPAVFPTQEYALAQLDELRTVVMKHFAEATSVGAKAIANASQLKPGPEDTIQ
jgi:alanine racemase